MSEEKCECTSVLTYPGGNIVDLANPDPDTIVLDDIAHHLSMLCRFTGAVSEFYSVAQHSIYVMTLIARSYDDKKLWRTALFHDAPEYVTGDCNKPFKLMLGDGYKEVEDRIYSVMAEKFDLYDPIPTQIKIADQQTYVRERIDIANSVNIFEDGRHDKYKDVEVPGLPLLAGFSHSYWADYFRMHARSLGVE
jgi:hypothetical protein